MLATPEDEMTGTMSTASLSDVTAIAMEQWHAQHCVLLKRSLKVVTTVKRH
jgi:hypothetical protein